MDRGTKGFTLIELLVALAIFLILITMAVPAFTSSVQRTKADTEVGDLRRALSYARLEAIDRGITTQVLPKGGAWTGELTVSDISSSPANVLRVVPAMSSGASLAVTSGVTAISFNNLGGLAAPATAVAITYVLGAQSRTLNVCLNGRILLGGNCG